MILRKPYAFLIKHFRFIHLIMTILMFFLLFQTNSILSFFNEYVGSSNTVISDNVLPILYNNYVYIASILIIAISVVIIILMSTKDKPITYYVITIIGFGCFVVLYAYSYNAIYTLQTTLLDERITRAVRDFYNIIFVFEVFIAFISLIRSIGLNLKKFEFDKDATELDISDTDNEEFEVNVEFNSQVLKRNVKRGYRNFKYYFIENKVIIIGIVSLLLVSTGIIIINNVGKYTSNYSTGEIFSPTNYSIKIDNSYITKNNYRLNKVTNSDTSLVVVRLDIKTRNKNKNFIYGKLALKIGDNRYYPVIKYADSLVDLGVTYITQELTNDFMPYLLVYEIPDTDINGKVNLVYTDQVVKSFLSTKADKINISISPINLDNDQKVENINQDQNYIVGNGVLTNYELKLNSAEVGNNFKLNYNLCVKTDECYDYFNYVQPTISGITDKAVLKLNMSVIIPEHGIIKNFGSLITTLGSIEYKIDGVSKSTSITKLINTTRKDNNLYAEIPKEIVDSEDINLVISARNNKYIFKIR